MVRFSIPFFHRLFGGAASAPGASFPAAGDGQLLEYLRQVRHRLEQEKSALGNTLQDISAVKLKEKVKALNDDRKFMRSLLESVRTPVIAVDLEGRLTYLNSPAQKAFGYTPQETAGKLYSDLLNAEQGDPVLVTLRTGEAFACRRLAARAKDSSRPVFLASTSILRDEEGSMRGVVAVMEDYAVSQSSWNRAARASRSAFMNDLVTGISSGIKNAAGVVSGYIQLLQERGGDASFRDHFTVQAGSGIERLSRLAGALAEFGSSGSAEERISLNAVVEQVAASLRPVIEKNGISLAVQAAGDVPRISASRAGLSRVFWNILMNACQSMPGGGSLTITSSAAGGFVRVTIQDTGCGIPHDTIGDIFRPFFTTRSEGLGLGLTIARQIVETYGGSIEVRSRIHAGTAVTVFFPCE